MDKTPETLVSSPAQAEENDTMYVPKQTKEEVIERLKELNEDACNADKQELDLLKQTFYKLHKAEQEAARKSFQGSHEFHQREKKCHACGAGKRKRREPAEETEHH